jgi:nucleotide-binding universal stress UspA family protein
MRFRRLLVPHDFSRHADRALGVAAHLAGPEGELVVLHAIMPVVPVPEFAPAVAVELPLDDMTKGARRELERVVQRVVGRRGPKVTIKVEVGDPYGRIVDNTRGMDAIVMSTVGRTGLARLVIGSVAEKVVRHSPIPVLTLRPRAGSGGARRRRRARG